MQAEIKAAITAMEALGYVIVPPEALEHGPVVLDGKGIAGTLTKVDGEWDGEALSYTYRIVPLPEELHA